MHRALALLAFPLLAATSIAACGSDGDASSQPDDTEADVPDTSSGSDVSDLSSLDGREFLSTEVTGYELVDGSQIRVAFQAARLSANAGCNTMNGGYTIDGDVLVAPVMASTMMACDPPLMDQDTWLSGVLSSEPTLTLDGDTLTIAGTDSTITMLDRTVADPDRPLEGTRWVVDGIVSNQAVSTVPIGAEAAFVITEGKAAVAAGCNTGSASAEITDTTITFGPLALTRKACGPEQTELENAVVATLSGEVTYEIEADRLTLRTTTADGSEVGLDLVAAE